MSKRKKPRKSSSTRRHLSAVPNPASETQRLTQTLVEMLRPALNSGPPSAFLEHISGLVESTLPPINTLTPEDPDAASIDQLIDVLLAVSARETTAALHVINALPAEGPNADITDELRHRRHPIPPWIRNLGDATVGETVVITDEMGDLTNYAFEVRIPGAQPFVQMVSVNNTVGRAVWESLTYPLGMAEFRTISDEMEPPVEVRPIDPAAARAIVEHAIDMSSMLYPPVVTESWPATCLLVEWILRMLPEGGAAPDETPLTDADLDRIGRRFAASAFATEVDGIDIADAARTFVWLAEPEPLRWSPAVVAEVLLDRLARKVVMPVAELEKYPTVLRDFVRFAHAERGMSEAATAETLATIDELEPEFQAGLHRGAADDVSTQLSNILRAALDDGRDVTEVASALVGRNLDEFVMDGPVDLGALDGEEDPFADWTDTDFALDYLDRTVGSREALIALGDVPLPDEALDLRGVPDDIHDRVREYTDACDSVADRLLDVEHRTAMRRFIARAARADPAIFRRKSATNKGAAAVAWVITKANDTVGSYQSTLGVGELLEAFGVTGSVTQRAEPLLRANGVDLHKQYGAMNLGTPDLLVSRHRRELAARRDRAYER